MLDDIVDLFTSLKGCFQNLEMDYTLHSFL
jgi:hypothetical protein